MKRKNKPKIKKEKKNLKEDDNNYLNKKTKRKNKKNEEENAEEKEEKESNISKGKDNINNNEQFQSNPKNIKRTNNIIQDSVIFNGRNFTFIVFKSIDNIFYIIYGTNRKSIIFYNLLDNKRMATIRDANSNYINYFRHILDENNKRDLILTYSCGSEG